MKRLRNRLESIRPDEDGEYRYEGVLTGAEDAPRGLFWGLAAFALLLVLLSGCLSTPGTTGKPFVIIPYVAELCGVCSVAMGLGKLGRDWSALRDYIFDYAKALPRRCLFAFTSALCGAAGELFSVLQEKQLGVPSAVYIALRLLCALTLLLFRRRWLTIRWREQT